MSGNITVSLSGKHIEKFINRCIKEKIYIWQIKNIDNFCYFSTSQIYYKQLRYIAKQTNCKIRVVRKKGIPFFLHRNRDKFGLLFGIIPFFIMLYILSLFVWNIEITGIDTINSYDVLAKLEEFGIYNGALMNNIDTQAVKRQSFYSIPELSWIAVNKDGSNIVIELTERAVEPELIDKNIVTNLKSTFDGQIVSMNIRQGYKEVAIGDAVVKGQLLVSGIMDSTLTNVVRLERAEGEVFARTKHTLSATVLLDNKLQIPTENYISRKEITLFALKIPMSINKKVDNNAKVKTNTQYLSINNNILPICIKEDKYQEYIENAISLSVKQANDVALEKLSLLEAFAYNDISIESKEINVVETAVGVTISVNYSCIENIAEEVEILVTE